MLTLYSYPQLFGVADNNGYGLKVYAFLKLAGVPTLLVTLTGWLVIEGGVFVFETKTVKALVALIGGTPLSVTTVAIKLVVKAWALLGVQVITPLPSIAAPAGGEINW